MGSEHSECIITSVHSGIECARGLYIHTLRNYSCAYLEHYGMATYIHRDKHKEKNRAIETTRSARSLRSLAITYCRVVSCVCVCVCECVPEGVVELILDTAGTATAPRPHSHRLHQNGRGLLTHTHTHTHTTTNIGSIMIHTSH